LLIARAAQVLAGLYGLDRGSLERTIFPGLTMDTTPSLLL
jgi:hypothetical protein